MKHVLIAGAGSYIGTYVEAYLSRWQDQYWVDTLDMRGETWRERSFAGYDAVFHVAGIVHREKTKNDPRQWELYRRVNTDLAIETARKAKAEGVGQFLFMSSESVYGLTAPVGKTLVITKDTPIQPADSYGLSKWEAEKGLTALARGGWKLAILRPPMVYGKGCKGNYRRMAKLAVSSPVLPWVSNRRSMLYIENLAEFVRLLLEDEAEGVFCPQDREYVNTSDMLLRIAQANGKHPVTVRGITWALKLLHPITAAADKAFGSLCYDMELSQYPRDYRVKDFQDAIIETEKK